MTRTATSDTLFQLPLPEFTAARNALVSTLRKAGKTEDAARVMAIPKPSVSAWVVNQLYWRHRDALNELLTAGAQFRKAQAAQFAGKPGDLRGAVERRHNALKVLATLAQRVLRDGGYTPAQQTTRRITTTLEALAALAPDNPERRPGRLVSDVAPPGFEAVADLVPMPRGGRRTEGASRVLRFAQPPALSPAEDARARKAARARDREQQRTRATAALKDAVRALAQARQQLATAEARLKKDAVLAKKTAQVASALERRHEKAAAMAQRARDRAHEAASRAEEAAQAVTDSERAIERLNRELRTLE